MTSRLDVFLDAELRSLHSAGRLRKLKRFDAVSGPMIEVGGKSLLSFGSNDYLGLASNGMLNSAGITSGTVVSGSMGSRLTAGNWAIHEQVEGEIAAFKHTEASVLFSSGYAANTGTIPAMAGPGDLILSDELNHASIIDGCRLSRAHVRVYRHCDVAHARELLVDRSEFRNVTLVTDGLFSMDGDLAPLPKLADLCEETNTWLMVDDAHGTGTFGETGAGTVEHFGLFNRVPIQMGTFSKACGCSGGFVAGSKLLVSWLQNKARSFVFSTAPPPYECNALLASLALVAGGVELRTRLFQNIKQLISGLENIGIKMNERHPSPIIPVIVGSSERAISLSARLESLGVWIPAIRPPTVAEGSARLRISVSAAHTSADISFALDAISLAFATGASVIE